MGRIVATALPNLVPPRHIDDCYAIPLSPLKILWSAVIKSPKCSALGSPARRLQKALVVPLLVIHEKNWQCFDPLAQGFPVALWDYFHQPNSLWNPDASPASHAIYRCVLLRVLHFYVCFRFLLVCLCSGSPRSSSLVLPLHPGTGFSVYLLTSNTESCDEDDEEVCVGVVEELVDKPRTTNGMWFLAAGRVVSIPMVSQSFPRERTAGVSSRNITVTNKSNSSTCTVAFSRVCTSPLAVITVVGLLDVLMVSNSAELRSRLLTMCILAPESTTNCFSSGSFVAATGSRVECSFVVLFELVNAFGKVPCLASGASLLSFSLFLGLVVRTSLMMIFDRYFSKRWSFLFPDTCLT